MLGIQHYASFIAAIVVFQAIPGAGTIAILHATARDGRAGGMGAVLGTLVGDLVFMIAAIAGVAAVMKANPALLRLLQLGGGLYLCWMGVGLWRASVSSVATDGGQRRTPAHAFRRALAVCLTNPKVVLFFFAFFPLFLTPGARPATLALMVLHVSVISLAWQTALVLIGNHVATRMRHLQWARKVAHRVAGVALVAFGVRLAVQHG